MKKIIVTLFAGSAFLISSAFISQLIINWKIKSENAQVKFTMAAHGQELVGSFSGVNGTVKFDSTDLANSSFNCKVSVTSIHTGDEVRDEHLLAAEWFNADAHPDINFTSSKISPKDTGYIASGKLTAKGVSKDLEIPFTFLGTGETGVFKGSFNMKRSDFAIGKEDTEVGDSIIVHLEIPVSKVDS